jgi:hypothetical protein
VGDDDHVPEPGEGVRRHRPEVFGRLVPQGVQLGQPVAVVQPGQLLDQPEVVQPDVKPPVVPEPAVAPPVVADHTRIVGERHHPGPGQPMQVRAGRAEGLDLGPDGGDRPPVEVVVAEDEVDRAADRSVQRVQEVGDGVRLAEVSGEQDGVGRGGGEGPEEPIDVGRVEEVEVGVGDPCELHGRCIPAGG